MKRVRTQPFVVVRTLIERAGKFLLVQENWGEVKGLWNLPAGWLDQGEDPVDGAIRETKEETGYDFTPDSILGIYSSSYPKAHPIEIVYRGSISGEQSPVDPAEISDIEWFSSMEILGMDTKTLRDIEIKQMVKDYLAGKKYPLELITHRLVK